MRPLVTSNHSQEAKRDRWLTLRSFCHFYSVWGLGPWDEVGHIQRVFPPKLDLSVEILIDACRSVSMEILNQIKMTMKSSHHRLV